VAGAAGPATASDGADYGHPGDRPLLRPLVIDGEVVGREPISAARARHAASFGELPPTAHQLSWGEPVIPTIYA
jgi:nicotinate phosphoribosyltransferase